MYPQYKVGPRRGRLTSWMYINRDNSTSFEAPQASSISKIRREKFKRRSIKKERMRKRSLRKNKIKVSSLKYALDFSHMWVSEDAIGVEVVDSLQVQYFEAGGRNSKVGHWISKVRFDFEGFDLIWLWLVKR